MYWSSCELVFKLLEPSANCHVEEYEMDGGFKLFSSEWLFDSSFLLSGYVVAFLTLYLGVAKTAVFA